MKTKRWLFGIILAGIIAVCMISFPANNGIVANAEEKTEVQETQLTKNVKYSGSVIINQNLDLNGYVMQIEGDLEIAADVVLSMGSLIVNGNVLHKNGEVAVSRGIIEVSGDYRIQNKRVLIDGTVQYLASEGTLVMDRDGDFVKIGGSFVTQSTYGSTYSSNYNAYKAGVMEIGGDVIQKNGHTKNFFCSGQHKVILTGDKTHKIEFESSESGFASLESNADVIWNGYMRIYEMFSDLKIVQGNNLNIKFLRTNGKCLDIVGDVIIIGRVELGIGTIKISGNLLHTDGVFVIDQGLIEIGGDYRIQNAVSLADGTIHYTASEGSIIMDGTGGSIKIAGDFITQSNKVYTYSYFNKANLDYGKKDDLEDLNVFKAGTIEVGGDLIQKNGDTQNFLCTGSHKIILTGTKPQKVEFESTKSNLNHLVIRNSLSNYTFTPNPCWNTLEESAISIADCTVKSISKKVYTGKTIKPSVTITYQGAKLIQDVDYTLSYANNKSTGKATVTIKGIGAYTGTVKKSFSIVPVKVASVKTASSAAKTATINWKEDKMATGYVIEYSTDKSFKKGVSKVTIKKNSTTSQKIEKLTSKKTYYFRIRAYKTISGKKVYGAYSSVATVQVK